MQVAVWIVLAIVVAFVVIDARTRSGDNDRARNRHHDPSLISTQKIIVDLTKRR